MTIAASAIIDRAQDILQDTTGVRWTPDELLRWLSDGEKEVIIHRPEAGTVTTNFQLTTSVSKQSISGVTGALRLLDITRNMGAAGTTPARAIRLVQREIMDAQNPNWHNSTVAGEIQHFIHDPRDPLTFYVYPRPNAALYIEAMYCKTPADITAENQNINIPDVYSNVLVDYILYRAYSKDAEYAGNGQRAVAHYQAFANALGIKAQMDMAVSPKANSPLNPNA